jgi:hypothetical protein
MQQQLILAVVLFYALTWVSGIEDPTVGQIQNSIPSVACASPEARQFDFWIGEWNINQKILQADGRWLKLGATTKVSPALDGCALIEHWEGQVLFFWEGMKEVQQLRGLSVRSFDPKTGKWSIYWMDTRNPRFGVFEGGFIDGKGEFVRTGTTSDGRPLLSRITFSGISTNAVEWDLAVSSNMGKAWQTLWQMEMRRKL